jgi:HprK-related kinase A
MRAKDNSDVFELDRKKIVLAIEPFAIELTTSIPSVMTSVENLYADFPVLNAEEHGFADFHIEIAPPQGMRRWYRPQVQFYFDGIAPFKPLPISQSYPFFEWGLNWCIATTVHQYLLIHAAVVEKNGHALILSGEPGAGKSTLCAALVNRGWRLLSDEMAVIDPQTQEIIPVVRPVSLKNESITIIKQWAPDAIMGESFLDTSKGTVAHSKPPKDSVVNAKTRAKCALIVFPKFSSEVDSCSLETLSKGQAVLKLADNSFNYNVLGSDGVHCVCDLVEQSDCYTFRYSNLNEAVELFSTLALNAQ